jgi:hypothetical protein
MISTIRNQPFATSDRRCGLAVVGAIIALAVLAMIMATVTGQILAQRRRLEHRHYELQADWLARSGIERAAARLLADPAYDGETLAPILFAEVRIDVTKAADSPDTFRIEVQSRYPADANDVVVRTTTRRLRRVATGDVVRLEPVE